MSETNMGFPKLFPVVDPGGFDSKKDCSPLSSPSGEYMIFRDGEGPPCLHECLDIGNTAVQSLGDIN